MYVVYSDEIIKNTIDISTTRMLVKSKNKKLKDWMTNGFLISVRHKQYLSMKCKKHPDNLTLALCFKKYKNNFIKMLRLN